MFSLGLPLFRTFHSRGTPSSEAIFMSVCAVERYTSCSPGLGAACVWYVFDRSARPFSTRRRPMDPSLATHLRLHARLGRVEGQRGQRVDEAGRERREEVQPRPVRHAHLVERHLGLLIFGV